MWGQRAGQLQNAGMRRTLPVHAPTKASKKHESIRKFCCFFLVFLGRHLVRWMCCVVLALLQEKLKVFLNFLQFKKKKEPEKVLLWGLELKSTLIDNHPTFFWVRAIFREIRVLFSDITF
jgi:hypothetical protein